MTCYVTLALIAVTVIVSWQAWQQPRLLDRLILWPPAVDRHRQYDRLLTHGFIHADWGHLLFNMITLYSFGSTMERYFADRITSYSRAKDRTPTLFLTFAGRDSLDAYRFLADRDIAAPADTFYAYEPAKALGVTAGLRIGLAPYNDDAEIDRLLEALGDFLR